MKGKDIIVEMLNEVLTAELTAVNQYWIHARMCENWQFLRLWKKLRDESVGEMKHADMVIKRILFLDGVPNMQRYFKVNVGQTVAEQMRLDLDLETAHQQRLNRGIELARNEGDNNTRVILEEILADTEEHVDWLEAQVELIRQVGEQQYLAQQMFSGDDDGAGGH